MKLELRCKAAEALVSVPGVTNPKIQMLFTCPGTTEVCTLYFNAAGVWTLYPIHIEGEPTNKEEILALAERYLDAVQETLLSDAGIQEAGENLGR